MVNVSVRSERHQQKASTGQHHQAAGVLRLLQDLVEMLVVDLNTGPPAGASDLRDEHQHELPLGDPHPVRLPVLQLQVEVQVELEGSGEGAVSGARQGRNSINSFNQLSVIISSSPTSHLVCSVFPLTVILTRFIAAKPASSGRLSAPPSLNKAEICSAILAPSREFGSTFNSGTSVSP